VASWRCEEHSDKFVIRKMFSEVKNLTFRYNTDIIRKEKREACRALYRFPIIFCM
jgi:hypothetical protein